MQYKVLQDIKNGEVMFAKGEVVETDVDGSIPPFLASALPYLSDKFKKLESDGQFYPIQGESFYYVSPAFEVQAIFYADDQSQWKKVADAGNCFPFTDEGREQAEAAAVRQKKANNNND